VVTTIHELGQTFLGVIQSAPPLAAI